MLVNESQIRALIRLLADEDEKIVRTISGKLIDIGPTAVPLLQEAEIEQPEMADRLVSILEEIRGGNLEDELMQLAALPDSARSDCLRPRRDRYAPYQARIGRSLRHLFWRLLQVPSAFRKQRCASSACARSRDQFRL